MITIPETRTLTLYLVDSDGMPVRAADEDDLATAGYVTQISHSLLARDLKHAVDENNALTTDVANLRDHYNKSINILNAAMSAAGAPDASSLVARIEELDQKCRDIYAALESATACVTELESRPLSPEVARVVEAARAVAEDSKHEQKVRECKDCWIYTEDGKPCRPCRNVAEFRAAIAALPSPLPVVVTCGECEHREKTTKGEHFCGIHESWIPLDGFCHLGKRREG